MISNATNHLGRHSIVTPNLDHREGREGREKLARHDAEVREVISKSMRVPGRKEVRDRMEKAGCSVSLHMLNAWSAPAKGNARFPLVLAGVFCEATGDDTLKRLILGPELERLLELGELAAAILGKRADAMLAAHAYRRHRRTTRGESSEDERTLFCKV